MLLACWWAAKFDSLRHEENIRKQYTTVAQDAQQLNSRVSQILNDPKRSQLQICKGQIFFLCFNVSHGLYFFGMPKQKVRMRFKQKCLPGLGLEMPWCALMLTGFEMFGRLTLHTWKPSNQIHGTCSWYRLVRIFSRSHDSWLASTYLNWRIFACLMTTSGLLEYIDM